MSTAPLPPPAAISHLGESYRLQREAENLVESQVQNMEVLALTHQIEAERKVIARANEDVAYHIQFALECLDDELTIKTARQHLEKAAAASKVIEHSTTKLEGLTAELHAVEGRDLRLSSERVDFHKFREDKARILRQEQRGSGWGPGDAC